MATNFFQELKRRKVWRAGVVYAVVGFGVIEVANNTFQNLGVPDWGVTLVIALVILGLPLALVLSWMFDVTPEGIERTGEEGAGAARAESAPQIDTATTVDDPTGAPDATIPDAPTGTSQKETSGTPQLSVPSKPSLAILPFVSLGADPEQDYFAQGLSADIGADLVKISGLFLVSRLSSQVYANREVTPQEVGRELGVRHVLEGSVRREGDRVRITAQLVNTETGEPLWADRFEGGMDDLFALHDRIVEEIVTALDVQLVSGEGARVFRRSFKNPKARDLCYRAEPLVFGSRELGGFLEARRLLEEASELEPDSPWPAVFAAWTHYFEATLGLTEAAEDSLDVAVSLADKAIELEDPTGMAHVLKGMIHLMRREHDEALEDSEKAMHDRPSCPWVYALQGNIFNYTGRPAEAIGLANQAIRLTPLVPPQFPAVLATGHYLCDQPDKATAAARQALEQLPDDLEPQIMLLAALAAQGRTEEARAALEHIRRVGKEPSLDEFAATQPYKDPAVLRHLLDELRAVGMT
jgi:adenylate cyclase